MLLPLFVMRSESMENGTAVLQFFMQCNKPMPWMLSVLLDLISMRSDRLRLRQQAAPLARLHPKFPTVGETVEVSMLTASHTSDS
jgi:hypothetical protein